MSNIWNKFSTMLEIVEALAEYEGAISSEEQLSDLFDRDIAPLVIEQYGADDEPAIAEAFNNWTDSLCEEGFIHSTQYDSYVYCGEYA